MFNATLKVLDNIIIDGSTYSQRGDADATYKENLSSATDPQSMKLASMLVCIFVVIGLT
ncbi:hypothetical protein CJ030_MR5G016241 [Morella rubra]|uniref:Uncharacterized protein n=1 Tax=Morella rubra TaxID=262757 RepID=A0A6A1VLL2_9ROSI|nr:hypothetical protein CJ030_MR5G016241 [Morella rubra]